MVGIGREIFKELGHVPDSMPLAEVLHVRVALLVTGAEKLGRIRAYPILGDSGCQGTLLIAAVVMSGLLHFVFLESHCEFVLLGMLANGLLDRLSQ